jgi:carbon starvation protein
MASPTATSPDPLEETDGDVTYIRTDADLPPVAIIDRSPITTRHKIIFGVIALLGAVAWAMIAFARGETVNAVWLVVAAIGTYIIGYRFYARLIEMNIVRPRDDEATPAEVFENGIDYMPTDRRVLFGHHFAAIAGAGPLVGPVLAMQMGYLPGAIWIVIGAVLAGCVQDYLVLWVSTRRRGRSLGQMVRDEVGAVGGAAATLGVITIMIILLAVLALVVVQALAQSPWGVFSIAMTIPIAIFMGVYLRFLRPGRISEVTLIGVVLFLLAIIAGNWVAQTSWGHDWFGLSKVTLTWCLIVYGFAASVLPLWFLLTPRDYLSTFMKVGTIALLAVGILIARPVVLAPPVSVFAHTGAGPVFAGSLFPFLFITIACGALSGFHSLISSGTTPKMLEKQSQMRLIGYGGMLTESFVGIMALVTAAILNQHLYFVLNAPDGKTGGAAESAAAYVNTLPIGGDPITAAQVKAAAAEVGEASIVSRTGGAPTLAIGMSDVLKEFGGPALQAYWYHFAIVFEAVFILTTVDAGTRVARFMLSDALGNFGGPLRKFRNPSWLPGAWVCSLAVVALWGGVLLMGVTDPLGGINTLFPLFGIANQLLAAIALTLVCVVVVKRGYLKWVWIPGVPLLWDLTVTLTASWQKIFSRDPALGYWSLHHQCQQALAAGKTRCSIAKTVGQVHDVIRNTFIQGSLSIVFAVLIIVVFATGVIMALGVIRGGGTPLTEDEPLSSRLFAPAGLVPTAKEREVQRQWDALATSLAASPAKSVGTARR